MQGLVSEKEISQAIENMKKFRGCPVSINDSSGERESSEEAWGKGGLMF